MDSKIKSTLLAICLITILAVVGIVILSNRSNRLNRTSVSKESDLVSAMENKPDLQIGNDLSAFKNDAGFFDSDSDKLAAKIMEDMITLSFECFSEEGDLRIRITDYLDNQKQDVKFSVIVAPENKPSETVAYTDDDRDGLINIENIKKGTYVVSLEKVEGYIVPDKPVTAVVNDKIPYSKIGDIKYFITGKSEAEAALDDLMMSTALAYADKKQDTSYCKDEFTYGIDVSEKYTDIDWNEIYRSGIRFVMLRAGYRGAISGDLIEDKMFSQYAIDAHRAGLDVGAYFYSQAVSEKEAVEEASALIELCESKIITYPVMIRIDQAGGLGRADALSKEERTTVAEAFLKTIKQSGYEPGLYVSSKWLNDNIDASGLGRYTIWMSQYNKIPTDEYYFDMWEYTSMGKVPGINADVAISRSYK